jgi:hypothetical protein
VGEKIDESFCAISHQGTPEEWLGHDIAFVRIFDRWIRFNDTNADFVNEAAAFKENFAEAVGSTQTATILLDVADDRAHHFLSKELLKNTILL